MEDNLLNTSMHQFSEEAKELYWPKQIQRIRNPTPLQFYRDFVSPNIPVIIEGMMDSWPALTKWNHEYLKNSFGKGKVSVDITPNGKGDCVIDGKYFVQPEQFPMEFGDFIDIITKEKPYHGVCYIQKQNNNFNTEFNESPLYADVPNNVELWGKEIFNCESDAINLWMGDDNAYSSLHKDHYENLYCVVKGQKNFTLLPAADIYYLHQQEYQSGRFRYNESEGEWDIVLEEGNIPWIPANPDCDEHYLRYPSLEYTSPLHVCVKPGEMLYLPSLIYHQVGQQKNEDESIIAINYWFDMKYDIKYNYYKLISSLAKSTLSQPKKESTTDTDVDLSQDNQSTGQSS